MKKQFIVSIFINNNQVYSDCEYTKEITAELEEAVKRIGDCNADIILVSVSAETAEEKEASIALLKKIVSVSEIPVTVKFPVKRTEDVKKVLYTNAKSVILNLNDTSNWEMLEEVSLRFGKEKIAVTFDDFSMYSVYRKQTEKYASVIYVQGAKKPEELGEVSMLPVMLRIPQTSLDKLLDVFKKDDIFGVYGEVIDMNYKDINMLKTLCAENNIPVSVLKAAIPWEELKLNSDGLIPVIAQDHRTGQVLMMAYMNKEAYEATVRTGKMNYYSRSRKSQWEKGETSGHFQYVKALYADCDNDTLLARISQIGPACHTGSTSCFFKEIASKPYEEKNPLKVFENVYGVIADRKINPKEGSYTNYLFDKGLDKILKKLGEEATEIVIASKNPDSSEIKYEVSDFLYHLMVLMVEKGITWEDITSELSNR